MTPVPIPQNPACNKDDGECCRGNPGGFTWPIDCCPKCGHFYYTWLTYEEKTYGTEEV